MTTTPPLPDPPDLKAEAEELLANRSKLANRLKQDMMEGYLQLVEMSKDMSINPQHRRAAAKEAQARAELIWRLNAETNK